VKEFIKLQKEETNYTLVSIENCEALMEFLCFSEP